MASSTINRPQNNQPGGNPQDQGTLLQFAEFVDQQLGKTKSQVKSVEMFTEMLLLGAATLGYMLLIVLADHWVFTGGLGMFTRTLAFLVLLGGVGSWVWFRLAPLFLKRVNPVFAAAAVERGQPTLKNSLINFLLLRRSPVGVSQGVYDAVERRAAQDLSQVTVEATIDRTHLLNVLYGVLALVVLGSGYKLFSPKDPLQSVGRLIFPWADLAAPTRVTITDIRPGSTTMYVSDTLDVKAMVQGLREDEPVKLMMSYDDGSVTQREVRMNVHGNSFGRHETTLVGEGNGLAQNFSYYLAAGDTRSPTFHVDVMPPPIINVERLEYEYPRYTGLAPRVEQFKGDIKASEGTRVTIHADTNQPIQSGSAQIDLDCNGMAPMMSMQVKGQNAWATLELKLKHDGSPEHAQYLLSYRNEAGLTNRNPTRYRIEVLPDLPPTIQFTQPVEDVEIPADKTVTLELQASDADYALRHVILLGEVNNRHILGPANNPGEALLKGQPQADFEGKYEFNPRQLSLSPGDEVFYWAEAHDTRQPTANKAVTQRWRIKILPPTDKVLLADNQLARNDPPQDLQNPNQPQPPKDPQPGENPQAQPNQGANQPQPNQPQPGQPQPGQTEQGQPQQGQPQQGENSPNGTPNNQGQQPEKGQPEKGQPSQEQEKSIDPTLNPGEAIEKINQIREQQEQEKPKPNPDQPNDQQQPGQGEQNKGEQNKGEQKQPGQGEQNKGEQNKGEQKQPGQGEQNKGQPQQGQPQQGNDNKGQPQPGEQNKGQPNGSQNQGDQKQPGQGETQPSSQPKGEAKQGEPNPDQTGSKSEQPGQGEGKGAEKKTGENQPSQPNASQNGKGEGKSGKPQPGQAEDKTPSASETPEETGGDPMQSPGDAKSGQADPKKQPDSQGKSEQPGGDREKGNQGNSSGGGQDKESASTPSPQGKNDPRNKTTPPPEGANQPSEEQSGSSPSISDKQSDSQGQESGNQSGGGEKGGGQKSNKKGEGAAGNSTESKNGASEGKGSGEGNKADRPGTSAESDRPTGQPGSDKTGNGSKTGKGSGKNKGEGTGGDDAKLNPDQQAGDNPEGKTNDRPESTDKGKPSQQKGEGPSQGQASSNQSGTPGEGNPGTNNKQNNNGLRAPSGETTADSADDANLEYAQKATDLALKYLKDELAKEEPNAELLKSLGGQDKLRQFVEQWEEKSRAAQQHNAESTDARRDWENTLRSLGLKPRGPVVESPTSSDRNGGNFEGVSLPPPPEYRDRARGFKTGIAKPLPDAPRSGR